jgi:hypothetical protein
LDCRRASADDSAPTGSWLRLLYCVGSDTCRETALQDSHDEHTEGCGSTLMTAHPQGPGCGCCTAWAATFAKQTQHHYHDKHTGEGSEPAIVVMVALLQFSCASQHRIMYHTWCLQFDAEQQLGRKCQHTLPLTAIPALLLKTTNTNPSHHITAASADIVNVTV